jgi:ABC-type Co2+ transport system permease subunit
MSETKLKWKRLLYSERLVDKNTAHKIAYVGVVTAFLVVGNLFFEFKLADTQFSFTLALSALAGMLIGPLFGFVACSLGDLVGFLFHNAGMLYMPWIGISMGLVAFFAGEEHLALRTFHEAGDRTDDAALASAVGTDERDYTAARDGKSDALDGMDAAVMHVEVVNLQHCSHPRQGRLR